MSKNFSDEHNDNKKKVKVNNDAEGKIYNLYINKHKEASQKYGPKTLILMMVGSFYEMYAVFDQGPNLLEISKLLNIICTRKNKTLPESWENPKMMGFQMNSLEKFLEILTNNNYTVIVYDQKTKIQKLASDQKEKKVITREVTGTYTKGININNLQQYNNNYLACIYIIEEDQKKSKPLVSVGLSCVDLSTGQVFVHSSYSEKYDEFVALDDASRFINNMNPGEILIYYDTYKENLNKNEIESYIYGYLNIEMDKCRFYTNIDKKYKSINFQNEYLKNIYPSSETLLSSIEQLDLESEPYITVSLCLLFDFIYDKMPSFLKNIKHPEFSFDQSHLVLGNNAIYQLDIFDNKDNINIKTKYKSLFHVVNETKTPLGERYLRNVLSSPFIQKKKLNEIYNLTEKMIEKKTYEVISNFLTEIRDIERLGRKMELKIIKPYEFCMFISSYENVNGMYKLLKEHSEFKSLLPDKDFSKNVQQLIDHTNKIFNMENLGLCNDYNFDERVNIYNKNIHKEIDELNSKIHSGKETVENLSCILANYLNGKNDKKDTQKEDEEKDKISIRNTKKEGNHMFLSKTNGTTIVELLEEVEEIEIDKNKKVKVSDLNITKTPSGYKILAPTIKKSTELFKLKNKLLELFDKVPEKEEEKEKTSGLQIKNNSQDGYYLSLTSNRAKQLQEILTKHKVIDLGYKKINYQDLEFKFSKNNAKILMPALNEHADQLEEYIKEISELYKSNYNDDIEEIYEKYTDLFNKCNEFVTQIDYLNSCALLSLKKGYTKPKIEESKHSFVTAKQIRHPIVERIIDYEYIPHDVSIGNDDLKGMLIYGLNSSGKSVLMKSIGLCIIMCQAGMYVPAESFTFSPYHKLMTRITGNDNIFKGLSSFGIELSEINSILKRSNENTLIIGDEVFRGTEGPSAAGLMVSTIVKLTKLKPTFIFTTHLHDIMDLNEIKDIKNVKAFHLKVSYDTKTDSLIYDRKLSEGSGERDYGVLVAKYIIHDKEFIDCATTIKNKILGEHNSLISGKKSKYNSDVYVYECSVCHTKDNVNLTNLETHHINGQRYYDENNVDKNKKHLLKNDKANLAVLCEKCHIDLHKGELNIKGYVKTSKGTKISQV
jgi:DNA mismatch repair ATPase MutS